MERFYNFYHKFNKKEINCLRLLSISLIFIILIIFLVPTQVIAESEKLANSKAYCVIDEKTNKILFSSNENKKMEMASTTKIMTAILAIENLDLEKEVKITKDMTNIEGSSIYLKEGQILKIKDLVYGLMLRSGNDSAIALAKLTSGSVENFVKLMNNKVKSLNLLNTSFDNPHGLHSENHYTTAYDLARIASYAMKNEVFKEICCTKKYNLEGAVNDQKVFFNKNKLLSTFDGANGIKTGYTKDAGKCLVSSAERDGTQLICVVLDSYNIWVDSMNLLDRAFEQFKSVKIIEKGSIIFSKGENSFYVKNDSYLTLDKNKPLDLNYKFVFINKKSFPIEANKEVGKIEIYNANKLIFEQKIYTINPVKSLDDLNIDIMDEGIWKDLINI